MIHYIYKITNNINGKIYIGRHSCKCKICKYMGSGNMITMAINKYGKENFTKEILFSFENKDELIAKENEIVTEEFCSREDTYNIAVGGRGGIYKGMKMTDETRKRMSRAFTGRVYSQKTRSKMSKSAKIRQTGETNSFFGKKHNEYARAKMSKSQKEIGIARNSSWWNNGITNIKIYKNDTPPEGYIKGRIISWKCR